MTKRTKNLARYLLGIIGVTGMMFIIVQMLPNSKSEWVCKSELDAISNNDVVACIDWTLVP